MILVMGILVALIWFQADFVYGFDESGKVAFFEEHN